MAVVYCQGVGTWFGRRTDGFEHCCELTIAPSVQKLNWEYDGIEMGRRWNGATESVPSHLVCLLGKVSSFAWKFLDITWTMMIWPIRVQVDRDDCKLLAC